MQAGVRWGLGGSSDNNPDEAQKKQKQKRQQTKRKARRARQGQAGIETNAQADGQKGRPTDRHNDGGGQDHKIALRRDKSFFKPEITRNLPIPSLHS